MADTASPEMHRLREGVRQSHDRLVTALGRIIRSSRGREVLQEPVFTIRSERMVLPVKAEMKGRMPGLVHDVSDTGATVFVEPYEMVELGNSWRELLLEEQREVLRVLRRLSRAVGEHGAEISQGVEALAELDLILARARLGRALGAAPPLAWEGEQPYLRLMEARHPLLPGPVVPLTLEIHPQQPVLLITGPNAGGKTVVLKTLGLLTLMYQAGLLPPAAEGSAFSVFDGVYADIGDQQSIEQARSTFSSHIQNIAAIIRAATTRSLVLLDELGTNTDPEEGSALARAVLGHLCRKGATTIATGHFRSVAGFVEEQPGMSNASVELDPETLMPTYRLSMGLPGRSYALVIASRLGLPQPIINHAQELLPPGERRTDDLLLELQQDRAAAVRLRAQAEKAQHHAQALRQELEAEVHRMSSRREDILGEMRRELSARAEKVRQRLTRAARALEVETDLEQVRHALDDARAVRQELKGREWRPPPTQPPWWRDLSRGDRVKVKGINMPATVLSPPGSDGRVEVLIGSTRARFDGEQLQRQAPAP
ncbi:MAG: endonuclease MutS2, partial [Dehalococcoidia bacterium]|nr:endonuclease MutS2 [Dehalococcoidia bacterium]